MAAGAGVTVFVDDTELRRKLKALEETAANEKMLRRALAAGAATIRKAAQVHAPVRTGELRKSIRVATRRVAQFGFEARVLADVWYAHFVELGTKPHPQKKSHRLDDDRRRRRLHPGAAAKPYLRPAFDERKAEAVELVRRRLKTAIDRLTGGPKV